MNYVILIIFTVSLCISFIINYFFITRPEKYFVKKANDSAIRFSSQSKPIFGGISIFFIFLIIMVVSYFWNANETLSFKKYVCLLIVVVLSFFMGLADDTLNTAPSFKFFIQICCALIFIFSDIYIHISPYSWLNYIITVLWVVGIMNSINMLDNMDAVAGLTTLSIFGGVVIYTLLFNSQNIEKFELLVLISSVAALLSFIFYNWSPAKMYLGDNGSQYLGALLAYFGITFFWNSIHVNELKYEFNTMQFLIVILAFMIPIIDTTTVTINRLLKGKSPFVGGKDHTTHHLFYLGLSTRTVAFILFLMNTIGVLFSLYLINNKDIIKYNMIWYIAIFPILSFLFLYLNTKFTKER